jgi:hypothetical protein
MASNTHTHLGKLLKRLAVQLEAAHGRVEASVPIECTTQTLHWPLCSA